MSEASDARDAPDEDERRRARLEDVLDLIERIEDRHQDWYLQSERDFQGIFRFNIVILGGVLSAFGYIVEGLGVTVPPAATVAVGFAFFFWIMSTFSVALSYIGIYARVGVNHLFTGGSASVLSDSDSTASNSEMAVPDSQMEDDDSFQDRPLSDLLETETDVDYYEEVIRAYLETLDHNNTEASNFRYALYHASILLLLDAVVVFALTVPFLGDSLASSLPDVVGVVVIASNAVAVAFGLALSAGVVWNCYLFRERLWWKVHAFWEKETERMPMDAADGRD